MMLKKSFKRNFLIIVFIILCYLFVSYIIEGISDGDTKRKIILIEESINSIANQQKCKIPNLPYDSPEMLSFLKEELPIDCKSEEEDWVTCYKSMCWIKKHIMEKKGMNIICEFSDIIRINDYQIEYGEITRSTKSYILQNSDFVRVKCKAEDGSRWSGKLAGIRKNVEIVKRKKQINGVNANVLMFGFDSMSRNAFMRKLPKSYDYLVKVLKADVLKGYNIVGDGTPQALIPLLTGFSELELPETRKRKFASTFVNTYPFIWKDFQKSGYVTSFNEDQPNIGTFSYRLNGFKEEPVDHYMRTYYQAISNDIANYKRLCVGSVPRHLKMLQYSYDFLEKYNNTNPGFIFSFHAELSHDSINLIGVADNDVLEWLKSLKTSGLLSNTILVFMSDHGNRFSEVRNTLQGKLEERLPFFSFTFPQWFKQKYSTQYQNFRTNVNRLTTPFDIHATLEDILHLQMHGITQKQKKARAISLFNEIPVDRSCANAFIEPHWCACSTWKQINDTSSEEVVRAAKAVIETINLFTQESREMCHELMIEEIKWSGKLIPQKSLLKFKSNKDSDGFEADLSASTKITNDMYQVKIIASPSKAIYESSVLYDFTKDKFQVRISDVSRINKYGEQARCIYTSNPELRKFCFCK